MADRNPKSFATTQDKEAGQNPKSTDNAAGTSAFTKTSKIDHIEEPASHRQGSDVEHNLSNSQGSNPGGMAGEG